MYVCDYFQFFFHSPSLHRPLSPTIFSHSYAFPNLPSHLLIFSLWSFPHPPFSHALPPSLSSFFVTSCCPCLTLSPFCSPSLSQSLSNYLRMYIIYVRRNHAVVKKSLLNTFLHSVILFNNFLKL